MPADIMHRDSVLPPDVQPPAGTADAPTGSVLVTGATGFLGAILLRELLGKSDLTAYCIVRSKADAAGLERIRKALEAWGTWDDAFDSRIRAVEGDISQPFLGMTQQQYEALALRIDEIHHCAAWVNWAEPYAALRAPNVLGTLELLRFACHTRAKHLQFVSSSAVGFAVGAPSVFRESDDMLPHLAGHYLAYAQSKCVAEALARQAAARGLPVTIYRPSLISGDSHSGRSNLDDLLSRLIKGCIAMRCAPDFDWLADCCPVDFVAGAMTALAGFRERQLRVFHLANPRPRHWREIVLWMRLRGYDVTLVPYAAWAERLDVESRSPQHPLNPLRRFFLARVPGRGWLRVAQLYEESRRSRLAPGTVRQALAPHKVSCPPLDAQLLDTYFRVFIDEGFLPRPAQRPSRCAKPSSPDATLFQPLLRDFFADQGLQVAGVSPHELDSSHSIIGEIAAIHCGPHVGPRGYSVSVRSRGTQHVVQLVVKTKARDGELIQMAGHVAALCGEGLARAVSRFPEATGLVAADSREPAIYAQRDPRFLSHVPTVYGSHQDPSSGASLIVLERLAGVELMDAADDISGWDRAHIEAALRGIAAIHAVWYRRDAGLVRQPWLGPVPTARRMASMRELWEALADYSGCWFADWSHGLPAVQRRLIASLPDWWRSLEAMPRTLIHNDFNPRNLAFRRTSSGPRLCVYDWELATLSLPQRDLAELLCFVLPPQVHASEVAHYVEVHRNALQASGDWCIGRDAWLRGFALALCDLMVGRFPMYTMIHNLRRQAFLPRVIATWRTLHRQFPAEDLVTTLKEAYA
jgi:thioester reductase-like protein